MRKTALAVLIAVLSVGCHQEASLTSPSAEPTFGARPELAVASSSRTLINPGPLCTGARSPGFYCQNQTGKNPHLDPIEFGELETEAASLLTGLEALMSTTVGEAVCTKGNQLPVDQLVRHLATLALNLAANLIDENTPLTDGSFWTVGEAFTAAIEIANNPTATKSDRNAIKDVLDAINNNLNTVLGENCLGDDGDGDGGGE